MAGWIFGSVHKKLRGSSVVYLYFVQEGMLFRCFHALLYPVFGQFFNIPGHQFNSLHSLFSLAWSLKIFFSFFSDSIPVFGYRRIPYITLGLATILTTLTVLSVKPMPEPYYATANCTKLTDQEPLNPDAPNEAFVYIVLFFIWYCGLSCADASVDGLLTQKSKLEPAEKRGTLISYTRMSRQVGGIVALLSVGILLNNAKYGGTFCNFGLEFNSFMWIPFLVASSGIIYAFMYTNEKDVDKEKEEIELGTKLKQLWSLFHKWNYLKLLAFSAIVCVFLSLRTPANIKIQVHWVEVEPLVSSGVKFSTTLIGGLSMLLYMKCFLNSDWRITLIIVILGPMVLEFFVFTLTVFDVFRNQYFWFVDDIFDSIAWFWFDYILELVLVEYAPNGIEGISYALIWAIMSIGSAIGSALANFIMSPFCLTSDIRYEVDSTEDRFAVWVSYLISIAFSCCTILTVFLIPKQKKQAQEWRQSCENEESDKSWNAIIFVALGVTGMIGATILNFMTMFESTRCYMIAGGSGCDVTEALSNCLWYPHAK